MNMGVLTSPLIDTSKELPISQMRRLGAVSRTFENLLYPFLYLSINLPLVVGSPFWTREKALRLDQGDGVTVMADSVGGGELF
jgi:hypothetical protein